MKANSKKIIKSHHYTLDHEGVYNKTVVAEDGCTLIPMRGYGRFEDFYLAMPSKGFYFRSANCDRYGMFKYTYFIDGRFIGAGRMDKMNGGRELYEAGHADEAEDYLLGHMLWSETTLGGGKINKRKAAARLSHHCCCETGRRGHLIRQQMRRQILNGTFVADVY